MAASRLPVIDRREVVLGDKLGEGTFGVVHKGRLRHSDVAVKVIKRERLDEHGVQAFLSEINILAQLYHPHVCLYMGTCGEFANNEIKQDLMIITELMHCDMEHLILRTERGKNLSLLRRMRMAHHGALGLTWLHCSDPIFIHRDVKPSNFLVDKQLRVKITDFGLAQVRQRGETLADGESGAVGTPLYMAPEVLSGDEITERSDVYSFGVVLWFLIAKELPFSELDSMSNDTFAEEVCAGYRPLPPAGAPRDLARLMDDCWQDAAFDRPTSSVVVDELEKLVLSLSIRCERARQFWRQNFGMDSNVGWESFQAAVSRHCGVTEEDFGPEGELPMSLVFLRELVVTNPSRQRSRDTGGDDAVQEEVSMEAFGRVVDFFGPFDELMLDEMYMQLSEPWFHGNIDTDEAESRMQDAGAGTYLVRFSSSSPGFFTISRVLASGHVMHQRITHLPMSDAYTVNRRTYSSLVELVHVERNSLRLRRPCPGSRFSQLLQGGRTGKYNYAGSPYMLDDDSDQVDEGDDSKEKTPDSDDGPDAKQGDA